MFCLPAQEIAQLIFVYFCRICPYTHDPCLVKDLEPLPKTLWIQRYLWIELKYCVMFASQISLEYFNRYKFKGKEKLEVSTCKSIRRLLFGIPNNIKLNS
jgi:hypothetical protein